MTERNGDADGSPPPELLEELGLAVARSLGGRASQNWLVRRGARPLVLRAHPPAPWQSTADVARALPWRSEVRSQIRQLGWPAARPVGEPRWHRGLWWTLEEFLHGSVTELAPARHAELLSGFHALGVDLDVGAQPGRLNHLAVLDDEAAEEIITGCDDAADRERLLRHLDRARAWAARIDWSASPRVLVHGDFARHNLLFQGEDLSGLLDFELSTVDRRAVDFIHVWRYRHDDVVTAYDAITPLEPDEWRMLLVDWWALLVSLAVVQLGVGRQPDRWELEGLRRSSPLSMRLERSGPG